MRRRSILFPVLTAAILTTVAGAGHAAAPASGPLLECHSFARAPYLCDAVGGCDRDLKLPRIRMDGAFRCVQQWLDCDLLTRVQSPKAESCPERANVRCIDAQQAQQGFLNLSAQSQRDQVINHCEAVDFQSDFLEGVPLGLGYGAVQPTCDAIGAPLDALEDYTACSDIHHTRLHAQLLSLMAPRSRELLEDHDWCALFPEEGVTPIVCNTELAPRPPVAGVPSASVGETRRCQKGIFRAYRKVLNKHLNLLEYCSEGYLTCELKTAHGDLSGDALDTCMKRALNKCERTQVARDLQVPRYLDSVRRACGDLTFADLTDILGFGDLAESCNADTIDEVIDCAADQLRCAAWDIVRAVEARLADDTPAEFLTDYATCGN
jgi:hypothetical protein